MPRLPALLLASLLTATTAAAGDVPRRIPHEGRLLRADGTAERGSFQLTFRIWDAATGGSAVWTETQSVAPSNDGYYAVELGALLALPALPGSDYWLGVTVQGESELAPRAKLLSAPFALRSSDSDRLGGDASTAMLRTWSTVNAANVTLQPPGVPAIPLLANNRVNDLALSLNVPLLVSGVLPPALLPTTTTQRSQALAVGECMTIDHNYNTYGVYYMAWMSDGARRVPMAYAARDGQTNIALGRPSNASSVYSASYLTSNAVDGVLGTDAWLSCSGCGLGYWQVDLGSVTMIDRAKVWSSCTCGTTALGWDISVSTNGTSFTAPVGSGSCQQSGSCNSFVSTTFTPVAAQYVRFTALSGMSPVTYTGFSEIEVYGAVFPVELTSLNQIRLCNYTGLSRDFTLLVGR